MAATRFLQGKRPILRMLLLHTANNGASLIFFDSFLGPQQWPQYLTQCIPYLKSQLDRDFVILENDEGFSLESNAEGKVLGTLRFDYEYEIEYEYNFSNLVCAV